MAAIVFLLGRPGSGKSQTARCLTGKETSSKFEEYLPPDWTFSHITDYDYLFEMFQEEQQKEPGASAKRFSAGEHGGFEVKDFGVLEEALLKIKDDISPQIEEPAQKMLLVEFARNDYSDFQSIWTPEILKKKAYCLYFHADIDICMERVKERTQKKKWQDDTNIPDEIMRGYYSQEHYSNLPDCFPEGKFKIIDTSTRNNLLSTQNKVRGFIKEFCLLEQTEQAKLRQPALSQ